MAQEQKKSRLAEWGSRESSGGGKLVLVLGAFVVLLAMVGAGLWLANREGDDLEALEDSLNSRYEETISVGVQRIGGQTQESITIDGVNRPDCRASDDGYLTCSDDPQPTPQGG